jgi:hypothetical protein
MTYENVTLTNFSGGFIYPFDSKLNGSIHIAKPEEAHGPGAEMFASDEDSGNIR